LPSLSRAKTFSPWPHSIFVKAPSQTAPYRDRVKAPTNIQ
jgi:hypothetical protein